MKKSLLFLVTAFLLGTMPALAIRPGFRAVTSVSDYEGIQYVGASGETMTPAQYSGLKSRADEATINYHYCVELYSAYIFSPDNTVMINKEAFYIPEQTVGQYAGSQIVSISTYNGVTVKNGQQQKFEGADAFIFLTYDLEQEPFYVQKVTPVSDSFSFNEYKLDTPYTIEAGKPVFVGYGVTCTRNGSKRVDYGITVDGIVPENDYGSWVGIEDENGESTWSDASTQVGSVCLYAGIKGTNYPVDGATIYNGNSSPMAEAGKPFKVEMIFKNAAGNPIEKVGFTYTINGGEPKTVEADVVSLYDQPTVDPYDFGMTEFEIVSETNGNNTVKVELTSVNGNKNCVTSNPYEFNITVLPAGVGFRSKVVLEEGTGTWCQFCPRGIVALEYLNEQFTTDELISIAVHGPEGYGEPMYTSSYKGFLQEFCPGFPAAMLNRNRAYSVNLADPKGIEKTCKDILAIPALANLEIDVKFSDDTETSVDIVATSEFALDMEKANYRLSFVLIENNVGPYNQTNGFSGGGYGAMGGWEKKGLYVSTMYNEVARVIDTYIGIRNSVPTKITGMEKYTYNHKLSLKTLSSKDDFAVIGLLVNKDTGVIESADLVSMKGQSGIGSVAEDAEGALTVSGAVGAIEIAGDYTLAEVYGIDGRKVASANGAASIEVPAGLYIVKVDNTTAKVLVK